MSRSQVKTMLVCFFDHKGIVHYEFIVQGQMVNQQCYLEVPTRLRESVWRKRPRLWPDKWILHHDNAPAHDVWVREYLAKKSITKMDHPPYSPDLAPWFWTLSEIKKCPEGTKICWPFRHPTQHENVTVRYSGKWFSRQFPAVNHHLTKCIASQGEYFEGNSSC